GYTGQMWIAEIGLYHYRNRVYNPRIGRFMQTDPIGQQGGINLYAYVGNDPVNYTDPWGLKRLRTFDRCVNVSQVDAHTTAYCWNYSNAASLSWGAGGYPHMDGGGGSSSGGIGIGAGAEGQQGMEKQSCPLGPVPMQVVQAATGLTNAEYNNLDPAGLQFQLYYQITPGQRQAIANVLDSLWATGTAPGDHRYNNHRDEFTGAQLPTGAGHFSDGSPYRAYDVRVAGEISIPGRGLNRLLVNPRDQIFYTNSHYRHFVPIVQSPAPCNTTKSDRTMTKQLSTDEIMRVNITMSEFPFVEIMPDPSWMSDQDEIATHFFDMRAADFRDWLARLSIALGFEAPLGHIDAVMDMPVPPAFETEKLNVMVLNNVIESISRDPRVGLERLAALISACRAVSDEGVQCKIVIQQ
ncbi:MAG: RHS repeat-associated core domain-containing protein, partial [Glycocaulis sp.]